MSERVPRSAEKFPIFRSAPRTEILPIDETRVISVSEKLSTSSIPVNSIRARESFYPYYEEPCFHIWINERLNLFCFLEEIMMRRAPGYNAGGGGILLLQNIERDVDVGLSFCKGEYYMCTAYGEENDEPDPLDTRKSIYDWDSLEAMPSIRWEIPKEES